MATLEDESERITVLYYGDYGVGKTTALAHMAKLGTVKYIRTDKGIKVRPLRDLGVPVVQIEPVDQFDPISLERATLEWRELLEENPSGLAGVVLDTATEWVARRIEVQVDRDWKQYESSSRRSHVEVDPLKRYDAGDVQDQYRSVTQEGRRIIRGLSDLPCHLGIGCQMRDDVDKKTGLVKYSPAVSPALRGDLIGYSDCVIRLVPEGTWPDGRPLVVGYPRPTEQFTGKDRYGVLPSRLADPTFDRVLAYHDGSLSRDTDKVQDAYREIVRKRKRDEDQL